jgi:hypothetical protein
MAGVDGVVGADVVVVVGVVVVAAVEGTTGHGTSLPTTQ